MDDEFRVIDGKQYLRITRCLGYFSTAEYVKWVGKVGNRDANRAGNVAMKIGSNVDEWVKAEKKPRLLTDEARACAEGYEQWLKEYSPKLKNGYVVHDKDLGVSGEPDLIWGDTVVDIKCSLVIRPSYWLQTEFYARCLGATHKAILRLDKNLGVYQYDWRTVNEFDWNAVKGLIAAYKFYQLEKSLTEGEEEKENVNDIDSTDK